MDNKWEYLVVTAWNENEAHVACRQLGFLGGGAVLNFAITPILSCMYICFFDLLNTVPSINLSVGVNTTTRTRSLSCNGTENFLLDCIHGNVQESSGSESGLAQDESSSMQDGGLGLPAATARALCDGQSKYILSLLLCVCVCACVHTRT